MVLALLGSLLFLGALLAGCLSPEAGDAGEDVEESRELFFEPGLGPGHEEPLVAVTNNTQEDAEAILAVCRERTDMVECANEHLTALLSAMGSVYAFDVLEAMAQTDRTIDRQDHPIAHVLGRHALYVYGTIGETLITCSHKVFQGCIHGALQEYFEHVDLDDADLDAVCPEGASDFELYACMHGLGHGLVLATGYDLPRSLDYCAGLERHFSRSSCYGGVFMENVVAHNDHIRAGGSFEGHGRDPQTEGDAEGDGHHGHHDHGDHHAHGGAALPDFWVDPDDLEFPCNAINETYRPFCWQMQTSLILFLNGGNFRQTAGICDGLANESQVNCYRSIGRDASSWAQRNPQGVANHCSVIHEDERRHWCIEGAVAELVTNYANPEPGLAYCADYPEGDRAACYRALGRSSLNHLDQEGLAALCAGLEPGYEAACREGARLGPASDS